MTGNIKRILLIAYACEPNKTSEPGVGWNIGNQVSQSYETIILTRENNRNAIESTGKNNSTFLYYDLPTIFTKIKKKLPLGIQIYYALWQWGAYFYAKKYLKNCNKPVDLVHHLSFAASWIAPPAYILKLPFVWGPIGGGELIPKRFLFKMKTQSILKEIIYICTTKIHLISIFSYLTRKKASAILFRTKSIESAFSKNKTTIYRTFSETAANGTNSLYKPKVHHKKIKVICVGRMIYGKGYVLAVKGFHSFLKSGGEGTLEFFGDGPDKKEIYNYIKDNGLESSVFLKGFVANSIIHDKMAEADILLHPSFREGGSWTIMEAMSYGLPVICLDTSGPKDMVTENAGLLVALNSPTQVCEDIGIGLLELSKNKEKYLQLSTNAHNRIMKEYTWGRRKDQISEVYEDIFRAEGN